MFGSEMEQIDLIILGVECYHCSHTFPDVFPRSVALLPVRVRPKREDVLRFLGCAIGGT